MFRLLRYLVLVLISSSALGEAPIPIYSYHTDPPFHLPHISSDLSRALVDNLNEYNRKHEIDKHYKLVVIERPKLNSLVESGEPYIIIWANKLWFQRRDPDVRSSKVVFWDADVWISHPRKPVRFTLPKDLIGKRIGGRKGYFYKGVTPLIRSGEIEALESLSDNANLKLLEESKVDAFVMSRSSLLYWFANGFNAQQVFVAQSPHDAFTRHILFSRHYDAQAQSIDEFLNYMETDRRWQNKLKFWGVDSLTSPFELELDELIQYPVKALE